MAPSISASERSSIIIPYLLDAKQISIDLLTTIPFRRLLDRLRLYSIHRANSVAVDHNTTRRPPSSSATTTAHNRLLVRTQEGGHAHTVRAARRMADFDLTAQLEALSLDPDVYSAYVESIMDEEGPLEERVESVIGILGSAVEEEGKGADTKLQAFGAGLGRYWEKKAADAKAAAAAAGPSAEAQAEVQAFQERLEAEKRAAEQELQRQAEELAARCQQDRTAARGREALLNKYGYDTDVVDEQGNVVGGGGGDGGGADLELGAILGPGSNANKAAVADAARRQREQAKAAHAHKVARDKEALAKQLAKKEAEKKRTQKREKQRGCG